MRKNSEQRSEGLQGMSRQERRKQERLERKEVDKQSQFEGRARPQRRFFLALAAGVLLFSHDAESPKNIQRTTRPDSTASALLPPDQRIGQYYHERYQSIEPIIQRVESSFPAFMNEILVRSPEQFRSIFLRISSAFQENRNNLHRNKYALFRDFVMSEESDAQRRERESVRDERFFFYDLADRDRQLELAYFSRTTRTVHLPPHFGESKGDLLNFFHEVVHVAQDNALRGRIKTSAEWDAYVQDTKTILHMRNEWEAYAYALEALNALSDGQLRSVVGRGEDPTSMVADLLEGPPVVVEAQAKLSRLYFQQGSSPTTLPEIFKQKIVQMTLRPKIRPGESRPDFDVDFSEYDVLGNH